MKEYVTRNFHALKKTERVWLRKTVGIGLVIGGILGFLPVLGYWMFPLGLALLSVDSPTARRYYRRMYVWTGRQTQIWRARFGRAARPSTVRARGTPRDS